MKSDIQIARETALKPISEIADGIGIPSASLEPYGRFMAKVSETLIDDEKVKASKLILVTAMSPTKSGNGKTTVTDLPVGSYTVTEKTDWSWRYTPCADRRRQAYVQMDTLLRHPIYAYCDEGRQARRGQEASGAGRPDRTQRLGMAHI